MTAEVISGWCSLEGKLMRAHATLLELSRTCVLCSRPAICLRQSYTGLSRSQLLPTFYRGQNLCSGRP